MKKYVWLTVLTALVLMLGSIGGVQAEIRPPYGEGQIGLQSVVLCEKLTLRQEPNTSSRTVEVLNYGDLPIVIRQENGWAYCAVDDTEDSAVGWVNADYLIVDPAWYLTEEKTTVYAWNDTSAPKIALLDKNTSLPILKNEGEWLIVSLRGATGWIHNQ